MRRGRILLFLVLIVLVGLAVLALVFTQFNATPTPTQAAFTDVFYAAQNIPQGNNDHQRDAGNIFNST